MNSIMQKEKECYLCRKYYDAETIQPLHEHHVAFGTANRKKSELFGIKVWLCVYHHEMVHKCSDVAISLKKEGQRAFEQEYSHELWMAEFGRNWL